MGLRYLVGPVDTHFVDQSLHELRLRGDCLAFGLNGGHDLTIGMAATWADVCSRLPSGWQPDFITLYLSYKAIPPCLWSAPVPIVGLAADWNLLWHYYRRCLPKCDLVLTDTLGVQTLARQGLSNALVANIYGCERANLDAVWSDCVRDIDILFVGNLNPAVQRERLPWLGRLAGLADRFNVVLTNGVYNEDYRTLLARARVVFNRSVRGECNLRTFEAAAAGALLFQEADNLEVGKYFQEQKEYIAYRDDDLESLLFYYLENEEKRRTIAEAGRRRVQQFSFAKLWDTALGQIANDARFTTSNRFSAGKGSLTSAEGDGKHRPILETQEVLLRSWQATQAPADTDATLLRDLNEALAETPHPAGIGNALAVALWQSGLRERAANLSPVINALRQSLYHDSNHVMASLNLAEVLSQSGQKASAIEQALSALDVLERNPRLAPEVLDSPHLPVAFDYFRVEWERAAWSHAGQPADEACAKHQLLRWRLHALLGGLTGDSAHYYEAVVARPDLPMTRAAFGCALGRGGKFTEATPHVAQVVSEMPFDATAARAYFEILGQRRDRVGQRRLVGQRQLLAKAAPSVVNKEDWFTELPPLDEELTSIIILCCNELDFTRQCVESVLAHTRPPYELVLIDNGSTDGTPVYLETLQKRPGLARVGVIRNDTNRGFAAGCNQGLKESHGRYLVLLNNDTIVTPGWLEGLIAWSHHDWPHAGIVGPMTNCASPPQEVPVTYRNTQELLAFAADRGKAFAGQVSTVRRLVGFCMLFRREVWEKVGGLDETFGLGFFEDDDLGLRVLDADLHLLMAKNVFNHHYGGRTFAGLSIDRVAQMETNFENFRAKWGDERTKGYRPRWEM